MPTVKLCVVLVVLFKIQTSVTIENQLQQTSEFLFNLTNYAVESRRIRNPCIYETNEVSYFTCMKTLTSQYHRPYYPEQQHFSRPQRPQSVMDVLYTISRNDVLRCVPRLLCEVTSDTVSRNRRGFTLPTLPLNFDIGSIIKLLATIDIPGGSPIPFFTKAALLGYVSKGNSDSCIDAYPQCPRDPNKLVQYLNNYNGGFFRYFNGVNVKPNGYGLINYPQYGNFAQKRILNKPVYHGEFFSSEDNRLPKKLSFPSEEDNRFSEFTFKKPKELPFSINDYYSNELDLQRPLPNHKATPVIFPLRTGTGDLRLDAEELDGNYKQKYNRQNNFVRFGPTQLNEGFYYEQPEGTREFYSNKAIFSFPV